MKLQTLLKILFSRFKPEVKEEWVKERLDVCSICVHNSDNILKKTFKENFMILANKALNFICNKKVSSNAICGICYCNLILKTSEEDEECGLSFVGKEPKWKSIMPPKK